MGLNVLLQATARISARRLQSAHGTVPRYRCVVSLTGIELSLP